ncbi:MAG: N-acetylmuramoyl-L-alanine amidase, partial [Gemmatimonadetes bacterium]|nr:N-acetylmuramoyl-L-alanine amidase [Gemmatimonadota bacterium]
SDGPVVPRQVPDAATRLDPVFAAAERDFGVPAVLLKSVALAETRFEMVRGEEEFPGQPRAWGLMALRGAAAERGASLARVTPEAARTRPEANIRAAAALLGAYAGEMGIERGDLAAWGPVVARYSGIEAAEGQAAYVHDEVFAALSAGAEVRSESGGLVASLAPSSVTARFPRPAGLRASVQAAATLNIVWRPSPNYGDRPAGAVGTPHMVVIHTCESSYSSCWSWLTNSAAQASAHYVVNSDGSEISKLVYESKRAWHVGATYYCSRNNSTDCRFDGYSSNHFTIGIEHAGYASQSSFPLGQIRESAELTCEISRRHDIPRDRNHIVSHARLQPYDRTDPGPNWPWTDYMNRVNSNCSTDDALIVDNNNNLNDPAKERFELGTSGSWTQSDNIPEYYGGGYYHAPTGPVSDPSIFWFYLPAAATRTIDAWWTDLANRSTTAPYIAYNAAGTEVGRASANQQVNGGRWNTLGTWSFTAGWNKVALSRWTTEGSYVVADAVRIR